MSSNLSKADEEQKNFEVNLKQLECPFTWDMDMIDKNIFIDYTPHDEEELIPLLKVMRIIMTIFIQTKNREELAKINTNIEECDKEMKLLKKESNLKFSLDALDHVVNSTKCHVFWKFDKKEKAKKIMKNIKSANSMDKFEYSTINACRSIGWSQYHHLGKEKAIDFIRKALKVNPECDVYHYILGKNLRRMRRDATFGERPSNEEKDAFLKAYEKSKNAVYGIYVAQMYRESKMKPLAIQIYEEIFRSKPKSHTLYLRLALGFIQLFEFSSAKKCLDEVAEECANNSSYLHYRGRYHLKLKQYKDAEPYLKKAIDSNNYPATTDYLRCMGHIDKAFDEIKYLLELMEKFQNLPKNKKQCLLLDIAFAFQRKSNIKQSLKYFTLAIEIDPQSPSLVKFYSVLMFGDPLNVFTYLKTNILLIAERKLSSFDENTVKFYNRLKNYCKQYYDNQLQITQDAFQRMRT